MAVLYSTRKLKPFGVKDYRFTITSKALGTVDINQLAQEMSAESTVTRHDIKAVLSSLEDHIISNLRRGNIVQLGDLGSFRINLRSGVVGTEEEVTPALIRGVNVYFRPSKAFRNAMKPENEFMTFKPYYPEKEDGSTDAQPQVVVIA